MLLLLCYFMKVTLCLVQVNELYKRPINSSCDQQCQIDRNLGPILSPQASIVHTSLAIPRWSDYDAPDPGTVVNVATELDVQQTVRSDAISLHLISSMQH